MLIVVCNNNIVMQEVKVKDLGRIGYKEAWDYQDKLFEVIHQQKLKNRNLPQEKRQTTPNFFLFCEHPPVYTLGKSGELKNLLLNEKELKNRDIGFFKTNRGGDITYHGPGQIVGYPVLDLDNFFTDIHKYMRYLEETIIRTLEDYGIKAGSLKGLTGVWLDGNDPVKARKICAMGVKCSRWITMHGFALNVNTNLNYFNHIIPCGINDKQVTSIEKELNRKVSLSDVKEKIKVNFSGLFNARCVVFDPEEVSNGS